MGDFATQNDIVAGLAGTGSNGGRFFYRKQSITTVAANYYSSWTLPGLPSPPTTFPTTQAVPTDATQGALNIGMINAPGGGTLRLMNWGQIFSSAATDTLYVRCVHMGGLVMNVTTLQSLTIDLTAANTAGLCALDGSDVVWFLEVYTAGGATSPGTITITYTNQAGTGSKTTTITGAASFFPVSKLIPIAVLASGDTSIKSIQSIQTSGNSGTAGNLGIVAMKRLSPPMYSGGNFGPYMDYAALGFPAVPADACIQIVSFAGTTTSGYKDGMFIVGSKA